MYVTIRFKTWPVLKPAARFKTSYKTGQPDLKLMFQLTRFKTGRFNYCWPILKPVDFSEGSLKP